MNKVELMKRIVDTRDLISKLIENLSEEKLEAVTDSHSGWSIKALIAHLTFWERATLNSRSQRVATESLRDVPGINADLLTRTKSRPTSDVIREFQDSGKALIEEISGLSEKELLGSTPWGDGKALWEHLADDTIVHYEEHKAKLICWVAS